MRRTNTHIDPSLVEIGDKIRVTLPSKKGIVTTVEGTVAKRMDSGRTRFYLTEEGATIMAYEPGKKKPRVLLIRAAEVKSDPLFGDDLLAPVKERIVS